LRVPKNYCLIFITVKITDRQRTFIKTLKNALVH
jgi:hypothetical protein